MEINSKKQDEKALTMYFSEDMMAFYRKDLHMLKVTVSRSPFID